MKTNKLIIVKKDGEKIEVEAVEGLNLTLTGENNVVTIYEPFKFNNVNIRLTGDAEVVIDSGSCIVHGFRIIKTRNIKKNKLVIGKDFHCGANCVIDMTDAGDIIIGDDAKWSWNIYVKSDDTHPIFEIDTKKCVNASTEISIGNHVWIGMNVVILKNSIIKDNSIIGACSVVASKFEEENVIVAGNPAKIRKRNINWAHGSVEDYIKNVNK
ncbi:MAG: acyltransferase [Alphaproteobacteria bacterium]|nr:acyltransferase [Alphaproteobacteria bacterium]